MVKRSRTASSCSSAQRFHERTSLKVSASPLQEKLRNHVARPTPAASAISLTAILSKSFSRISFINASARHSLRNSVVFVPRPISFTSKMILFRRIVSNRRMTIEFGFEIGIITMILSFQLRTSVSNWLNYIRLSDSCPISQRTAASAPCWQRPWTFWVSASSAAQAQRANWSLCTNAVGKRPPCRSL